jgi:hypothetical protein
LAKDGRGHCHLPDETPRLQDEPNNSLDELLDKNTKPNGNSRISDLYVSNKITDASGGMLRRPKGGIKF